MRHIGRLEQGTPDLCRFLFRHFFVVFLLDTAIFRNFGL